jgi:CelD/BcsL family acetyltransferase involved in cellulose biosynthesis
MNGALLAPSDPRWLAFIAEQPEATVFHHPAWMSVLAGSYGYDPFVVVVHDDDGAIQAGLPLMKIHSRITGRRWVSLPFSDYCNPLSTGPAALEALTDRVLALAEQGPRVELRWRFPHRPALHPYSHYVLHTLPLHANTQQVSRQFDSMHRQNVRAARKKGVKIVRGTSPEHIHAFYQLHFETRQRKGVPVQPWRFFQLIQRDLLDAGLGFVLLAYKDRDPLAGAVFLHWGRALMCKYSASHEDTLDLRPNNLIFWEGIQWGCAHGFDVLDLGRTARANGGLREFKIRWGAEESDLCYTVLGANPPSGPDGRLMRGLEYVIRRAPPWVCRWTGQILYKHVG